MTVFDLLRKVLHDDEYYALVGRFMDQSALLSKVQERNTSLELASVDARSLADENDALKLRNSVLNDLCASNAGLPLDLFKKMQVYENKYPTVDILYAGRYIGKEVGRNVPMDVKNWALCGQNDFGLKAKVANMGAMVVDVQRKSNFQSIHQAFDEAVRLIHGNTYLKYVSDIANPVYGSNEFWAFAFEADIVKEGDCNSDAVERYVLCRIAGVPAELLRIVAGDTASGGHCTLMYYDSSCTGFKYLNSTTRFSTDQTLQQMINHPDNKTLAITKVWFSFNEKYSWQQLPNDGTSGELMQKGFISSRPR